MAEDRSGGIASFGVSFGDRSSPPEDGDKSAFRIVVVAEVVAGSDWSTGRTPPLDPIPIDTESFDRIMGQLAPSLAIDVADPFGEAEPAVRIDLMWRDRKSMRPNEIVQQVPVLRALADARRVVLDVASRRRSAEDARAELTRMLPRASWANALVGEVRAVPVAERAPAPAAKPAATPNEAASKGGLDALLDMVDVGQPPPSARSAESAAAGTSHFSNIVASVARSARVGAAPTPRAIVGSAPERLEKAFQNLLSSILRHPEVRRIERTWRGLRLLVEHCDKRAGVEVDILSSSDENVDEALSRLADVNVSRAPVDLLIIDRVVSPTAAGLAALEKWAARAESMLAPLVVGGEPEMVGADSLASIARSTSSLSTNEDGRAVAVRAIASREAARWVAIVLNDPLIRLPYTETTARQTDPKFAEDAADLGAHVFANGAYVVGALCAKSFVRLGWPTSITGARDGAIGNLPVHTVSERGTETAIALEALPSEDAVKEMARAGLTMLTCAPNADAAILSRAPVLHRLGGGNGATTATLADQLFVGRFARAVQQVAAAIPQGTDPRAAEEVVRIALMDLFGNAPPSGPEIAAKVDAGRGQVAVTVRPRRFAGISLEEITLGAALG